MLIKRHRDGFTLIVVCACLFFCSGLVISYYRFYYQQALTYHRLSVYRVVGFMRAKTI